MNYRIISKSLAVILSMTVFFPGAVNAASSKNAAAKNSQKLPLKLIKTTAADTYHNPEYAIDADSKTEFTFDYGNGGAELLFDLGGPKVVESVRVLSGPSGGPYYLQEVKVGPDPEHMRPLLGRPMNIVTLNSEQREIELLPSVGRYLSLSFSGGRKVGIADIEVLGRENRPERHLCHWWGGDVEDDFLNQMDYLENDLGVTDIWIDKLASVMTNSRPNYGFAVLEKAGVFRELRKRNINYWLSEDEGFGGLVNVPDDLRDEQRWQTTLRQARQIYAQARKLGFKGIAMDAEDYAVPTDPAVLERYLKAADVVDCWTFNDEFGYPGLYYQRGLQLGKVIEEVWGCPLIQFYEASMYAGPNNPGCRDGNYWWLKGISDAGVEIWLAPERTYGAGNRELYTPEANYVEFATHWFVNPEEYIPQVYKAYPFVTRVLPGFHPWIDDFHHAPLYLPKYLDEQLSIAENCVQGYWIYNGGTPHAGNPTKILDKQFLLKHGLTVQSYIDVFKKHPTSRIQVNRK